MTNKKTKYEYEKARDWTAIVYPESAPENWRSILDETHLRWIESPLHDKDTNPDGEIKKAHYHIMLSFDGPTTKGSAEKILKQLNTPDIKKVGSARGLVRYMIHMDNPEKYQYERSEIIGHNGVDIEEYFKMTASNRLSAMKEIMTYIYDNKIDNYADFISVCIEESDDWFDIAINSNTLAINKMIDAMWQKNQRSFATTKKADELKKEILDSSNNKCTDN